MDQSTLESLLRQLTQSRGHTPDCPTEDTLVSALDGKLLPERRKAFDQHVANCDNCISRLGQVARLARAGLEGQQVPDTTMARARRIPRRLAVRHQAPRWAAAAVLVLAVAIFANRFTPTPELVGPQSPAQQARNIDRDGFRLSVLIPSQGSAISRDNGLFRWSGAPDSLYYDVRIVSGDGTLVWKERTELTEWRLPAHLRLGVGEDYYFRVDAYLTVAKSVSSPHMLFTVKESQ